MTRNDGLQGKTAIVTGASSGLGADFARELARRGANLILVARREEQLRAIQQEIVQAHGVQVDFLCLDLAVPGAPEELYRLTEGSGQVVDVLVNNAGFGLYGQHLAIPWEKEKAMLDINIIALAHLTRLFAARMVERNFGYVLLVSSIGAFQPSPTYASYSASKSYVLHFGEALNYELRTTGVGVTVVAPGVTATEFLKVAGQSASRYQRLVMMKSPDVTRAGIDAMLRRRPSIVPGLFNSLSVFLVRFLPRRLSAALANLMMEVK